MLLLLLLNIYIYNPKHAHKEDEEEVEEKYIINQSLEIEIKYKLIHFDSMAMFLRRCIIMCIVVLVLFQGIIDSVEAIGSGGSGSGRRGSGNRPSRSPSSRGVNANTNNNDNNSKQEQQQKAPSTNSLPPRKRTWMNHFVVHKDWNCTQIPANPVIIGGDGGGVGHSLEKFLIEANAVQFGPVDDEGNSLAEIESGVDNVVLDIMEWAQRPLYDPNDMPYELQYSVADHLCRMFARQEKWVHPDQVENWVSKKDVPRWGWKDPYAQYLLPLFADTYLRKATYVHLVRDPRTFPIGGLHAKERDLQKKYFGQERWEKLTKKFEQEWEHLKNHAQMKKVEKYDVIDLLRTTAHWTAVNFEVAAFALGPYRNNAIILKSEDLVQPRNEHWKLVGSKGNSKPPHMLRVRPLNKLISLLKLPSETANTISSFQYLRSKASHFSRHESHFDYRVNSPLVDVQTRIANRTLTLLKYPTDPDLFVPDHHDDDSSSHGHRISSSKDDDVYAHPEHKYTDEKWKMPDDGHEIDERTGRIRESQHMLGMQLKPTERRENHIKSQIPPETDEHRRIKKMLDDHVRKNDIVDNMIVKGQKVKDLMMQY